jgi:hypothetical protein
MLNLLNGLNGGGLRWASVGRNYVDKMNDYLKKRK